MNGDDYEKHEELEAEAKLEQAIAQLSDVVPRLVYSFYLRCCDEGFEPDQALHLATAYMTHGPGWVTGAEHD